MIDMADTIKIMDMITTIMEDVTEDDVRIFNIHFTHIIQPIQSTRRTIPTIVIPTTNHITVRMAINIEDV
ncbi:hypothetical protein OXB_3180 [Bacillus sp. OxB-1]|nr:hypothetical protein OXB_3180 [Bacillus sp. OxB-1]